MFNTNEILSNVFGGIGLILWSIQLVPQSKQIDSSNITISIFVVIYKHVNHCFSQISLET